MAYILSHGHGVGDPKGSLIPLARWPFAAECFLANGNGREKEKEEGQCIIMSVRMAKLAPGLSGRKFPGFMPEG